MAGIYCQPWQQTFTSSHQQWTEYFSEHLDVLKEYFLLNKLHKNTSHKHTTKDGHSCETTLR